METGVAGSVIHNYRATEPGLFVDFYPAEGE